jgi:hypothetical protein
MGDRGGFRDFANEKAALAAMSQYIYPDTIITWFSASV